MMESSDGQPLIHGMTLSSKGEVTVAPELEEVLVDLALELQEEDDLPIDVEHVVAAVVLGVQNREFFTHTRLTARDRHQRAILLKHIRTIFDRYGGDVCEVDDSDEADDADETD